MQTVTIPEKVKQEFKDWYMSQWFDSSSFYSNFWKLHYPFQSGVYRSFLRSVGIVIEVRMYPYYHEVDKYQPIIIQRQGLTTTLGYAINHDDAEIAAINAGLNLRNEQLELVKQ